ncbi:ATP-binding protein [Bradyrhizobium canariense]|uniref:ATP-binding protein n=1 Tax=Bradyrhizobium canariense TaxID=255045 RepID=UPI000A18A779|nr:ATP-binding protein [Bradyrhizobium canariense]OSI28033.1 hybrid sensor histidine kinase/response regulator [Bradyrhizobium canariense]OSI32152.1 hybrid sensor histidine kinase/response regulator [Bradyrhizobium canariense]OSI41940.1 hybrid sensor histidine kinase/response regulator [Bradyrhizobium canariense]OSI47409.1 hybrid sensor histidine kinase/response regulator [Bradyrhizobium canariense]OSI58267.1 hybrid sensor histidine kinase/response regulator [Bradyrhizobium canariense]
MSLRTRLLILVIAAMLVPASLVGLRFVQNRSSEVNAALANLSASADDIASDLGGKIQGTAQLHYGLARARDLDTRDKAACSAFLSDVREEYPQFTGILTIDPDGSLFCDSLRTNRTLDLRDRAYFKQALVSRNVVVEPVFGRLTGISVLQIAYPVRSEAGALKLVLLASFNLRKFAEYHHKRLLAEKDILLIDGKGTVLVAPSGADWTAPVGASIAGSDLLGFATAPDQKAFQEVTDRDGRTQVWAVAHSPSIRDAGLYILVGRSKDGLVAAANRRLYEDMAILAVALLLLLLAGVWILATVSVGRQVGRLANMAKRLGLGDLNARIPPPHPRGELGGLMTLLNDTAESLEQQRAAIADLNQKLSQSQKMEAMGQLTGGVAHDFNNLLTVILGNSEHLADRLAGNKELHRIAGDIATAAERGSDLTRSLLAFARKQPLRPRDIDIGEKIKEVEHLLRRPLGEHIECTFALAPDLWLISVDPGQLTTALLNLVLNARDVMQLGGRLTIEARNVSLGESDLDINGEPRPGDYVMVAVIDTGSGMTAEVASRAFEPFFTTKEVGKGTGLGLSMVYGFVRQSGGLVQMQSAPRQGSTVRLFFPRLATPPNEDASPAEGIVTREGSETILVVEDNDMVRTYVESELKTLGYRVITAASGPAALDLLRQSGDIDLLFTDVVMPGGMFGPELARQAIQLRPGLKVLFTSGYSQNPVSAPDAIGDARILTKPFRRRDLAAMLRSALSTPSR